MVIISHPKVSILLLDKEHRSAPRRNSRFYQNLFLVSLWVEALVSSTLLEPSVRRDEIGFVSGHKSMKKSISRSGGIQRKSSWKTFRKSVTTSTESNGGTSSQGPWFSIYGKCILNNHLTSILIRNNLTSRDSVTPFHAKMGSLGN